MMEDLKITAIEVEKEAMSDVFIKHCGGYAAIVEINIYALMDMLSPD